MTPRLSQLGSTRLLGAFAFLALVGPPGGPAQAQLPPLPLPPPHSTASERLVGDLATRLLDGARVTGAAASFEIEVSAAVGPIPGGFGPFLADSLAAALRQRGWLADRAASAKNARPPDFMFDVELRVQPPTLVAAVRLRRRPASVWEELRAPEGSVLAIATAETALDAELRALLGLPLGKRASVRRARLKSVAMGSGILGPVPSPALDMVVTDLDGDRRQELILLFPRRVVVVGLSPNRHAAVARHVFPLADHLPPNPSRVRAPLGRLLVVVRSDGSRTLLAAVTEYAHPAALRLGVADIELDTQAAPQKLGWPLYQVRVDEFVGTAWPHGRDVLAGAAVHQRLDGSRRRQAGPLIPVYDVRAFSHRAVIAPLHQPFVVASVAGGGVGIRDLAGPSVIGRHGLATVVGDLDLDGVAELLVTSAEIEPSRDRVTIYRLAAGQPPTVVRRVRVRGAVTALAAGDADGDALPEYWVASWNGRRARLYALGLVTPR